MSLVAGTDLPKGWEVVRIGDRYASWGGHTPSKANSAYWGDGLPWVSSGEVKSDHLSRTTHQVTKAAVDETGLRVCPVGTVLVVVRSGVLAHSLPVAIADAPVTINQDVKAFYSDEPLLNEWLALYLKATASALLQSSRRDGTTVQSVQNSLLQDTLMPLAPVGERQRIIERIQQALRLHAGIEPHVAAAKRKIDRFRQAVLAAACSGRITADWRSAHPSHDAQALLEEAEAERKLRLGERYREESPALDIEATQLPETWAWGSPGGLCVPGRVITYGVIKLGPPVDGGVPTLRSSDVRWLNIDATQVKRIGREIADSYKRTCLQGGEVLVTVRGTLGGVAVAPATMTGWNVSREVAVLPLMPQIDPTYCALAIASTRSQNWLSGVAKGVAYTGVNIEDLRRLPLPLPPLEEQREIVKRVDQMLTTADGLVANLETVARRVDGTSQSVLAKAFRGELTSDAGA